jgi:hypothetical protein
LNNDYDTLEFDNNNPMICYTSNQKHCYHNRENQSPG